MLCKYLRQIPDCLLIHISRPSCKAFPRAFGIKNPPIPSIATAVTPTTLQTPPINPSRTNIRTDTTQENIRHHLNPNPLILPPIPLLARLLLPNISSSSPSSNPSLELPPISAPRTRSLRALPPLLPKSRLQPPHIRIAHQLQLQWSCSSSR